MRIGIYRGDAASGPIDKVVGAARDAADAGYASFWLPQTMGMDAMTGARGGGPRGARASSSASPSSRRSRATRS